MQKLQPSVAQKLAASASSDELALCIRVASVLPSSGVVRESYDHLNARTKRFVVQAVLFAKELDNVPGARWLAQQFVRCATSVAANQRAARRARSDRELVAKLSIVVEEADESVFWCELLKELPLPLRLARALEELNAEALELLAIFSTGRATMRRRLDSA